MPNMLFANMLCSLLLCSLPSTQCATGTHRKPTSSSKLALLQISQQLPTVRLSVTWQWTVLTSLRQGNPIEVYPDTGNRICERILAHESVIISLFYPDSVRLVIELRNTINDLFHLYHGKTSQACYLASTTTTSSAAPTDHTKDSRVAAISSTECDTNKLISLVERKLLELVAIGSPRETLRILCSRLLEVIKMKEAYEEADVCVGDEKKALKEILAEFDEVQALMRFEF